MQEAFGLSVGELVHHPDNQARFNRHVRIDPLTARLTGLVGLPVRDCLLVKPDCQIAPAAQPFVVFRPVANVVLLLLRVLVLAALGILHARTYLGHHHRRISLSARAVQQRQRNFRL